MRYSLPASVVSLTLFTAPLPLLPIDRPVPLISSVVWAQTVEKRKAEVQPDRPADKMSALRILKTFSSSTP